MRLEATSDMEQVLHISEDEAITLLDRRMGAQEMRDYLGIEIYGLPEDEPPTPPTVPQPPAITHTRTIASILAEVEAECRSRRNGDVWIAFWLVSTLCMTLLFCYCVFA